MIVVNSIKCQTSEDEDFSSHREDSQHCRMLEASVGAVYNVPFPCIVNSHSADASILKI